MSTDSKRDAYSLLTSAMDLPVDVGYMVYIIMFYEGVGNLFPWNAFITASNYYGTRFCGTSFETTFENFFSITYTLSQTIGLALSIVYQNKLSLRSKVIYPLMCYSAVFLVSTILVTIQDIDPTLLFWLTLISCCLCGLFGAVLSGGLFGLGAMFPPVYTAALMNGQGVAGLTVAVASLLTSLGTAAVDECSDDNAGDDGDCAQTLDYSALAYFIIATLILASCIFAFLSLNSFSFARYYIAKASNGDRDVKNPDITNPIIDASEHDADGLTGFRSSERNLANPITGEETAEENSAALSFDQIYAVFSQVRVPSLSVFFVFSVTIGLFPSLIVLLESENKCKNDSRFFNDLYVPFFFLLFNLFDLIGRVTAGAITPLFSKNTVWIASAARVVFFPLFLLCNISDSKLPVVFKSDAFPILFMMALAFSNGYVASLCMMMGAGSVAPKDAPVAGTIMVFSLTAGLCMGACLSFIVVIISQGSV